MKYYLLSNRTKSSSQTIPSAHRLAWSIPTLHTILSLLIAFTGVTIGGELSRIPENKPAAESVFHRRCNELLATSPPPEGALNHLAKELAKGWSHSPQASPENAPVMLKHMLHALSDTMLKHRNMRLHNREDLMLHYLVGIKLGMILPQETASGLARAKEINDIGSAGGQGSGFDFNDLAASLFGIKTGHLMASLNANSASALLNRLAAGQITLTALAPKTNLPHLKAGHYPDPKQEATAKAQITKLWTKTRQDFTTAIGLADVQ